MEKIRTKQTAASVFLVVMGALLVIGGNAQAGSESYLAMLLAGIPSVFLMIMYAYLMRKSGEKGLFDLLLRCWGKVGGKIAVSLIGIYALVLGSVLLGNFLNFTKEASLLRTSKLVVGVVVAVAIALIARAGRQAIARHVIHLQTNSSLWTQLLEEDKRHSD